jgi:hypothetical protein
MNRLFCIEVFRAMEEPFTFHIRWDLFPSEETILVHIDDEDCGFDPQYDKYDCYEVFE